MSKSNTKYWLCLAVLVFYHDLAVLALHVQPSDLAQGSMTYFRRDISSQETSEETPEETSEEALEKKTSEETPEDFSYFRRERREVSSTTDCPAWQVYDGNECVCSTSTTSRCTDQGGMVCDKAGNKYPSACHFSMGICEGKIPMDEEPRSCGFCKEYRLVRGMPSQSSKTVAVFIKSNTSASIPTYKADAKTSLFRVDHLNAWAIGLTNQSGDFIAMVQDEGSVHPQDSTGGMRVLTQNGTQVYWDLDPLLRFECSDGKETIVEKMFIFTLIFAIVAAAVTVTSTVLRVVQAKRGCLYYPSVCELRDEIRDSLKPEVLRLRDSYKRKYGEPQQFKDVLEKVQTQAVKIRDNLVVVDQLYVRLNKSMSYIDDTLGLVKTDFPDFAEALTNYNDWQSALMDQIPFNILGLELELVNLVYSISTLTAETVSTVAAAASIIGSVLAIGLSIADIVESVLQERQVRDDLQEAKNNLLRAKSNINTATRNTQEVQKKLCQSVITFMYKLSSKGAKFHDSFLNLKSFLSSSHFSFSSDCTRSYVYEGSSYRNLKDLHETYMKPLLDFTENSIAQLNTKIQEVTEIEAFFKRVKSLLKGGRMSPKDIFHEIHTNKPAMAKDAFSDLFSLLKYAAKEIFPSKQCFWGYDLAAIRIETLNERNIDDAAVCQSPEIEPYTNIIVNSVSAGTAPCRIVRQVTNSGGLFGTVVKVVRYIADYVLSSYSCYWGYDLQSFRDVTYPSDVTNAVVTSSIFTALAYFNDEAIARNMLCTQHKICNNDWQTFLLCTKWGGSSRAAGLDCSRASARPHPNCAPSTMTVENCNV